MMSQYKLGKRPCIIVSNNLGNYFSENITVVPCTTNTEKKPLPTHVALQVIPNIESLALCENIVTVSKRKCENFLGILDDSIISEIDEKLKIALGLVEIPKTQPQQPQQTQTNSIQPQEQPQPKSKIKTKTKPCKIYSEREIKEMQEFIQDCDSESAEFVMQKYNINSKKNIAQKKYYYKTKLKTVASD